jgi:Na+-transporting methylmalonyl-CoA/oxaloacetate decarboxylase gamma subunit
MIKFFKFLVIGFLGLIGLGLAFTVLGIAVGLAMLAVKIGVIAAIGYGVYRLLGGGKPKPPEISAEDRKWLES